MKSEAARRHDVDNPKRTRFRIADQPDWMAVEAPDHPAVLWFFLCERAHDVFG